MYGKFKVFKKLRFVFVLCLVVGALSVSCVEVIPGGFETGSSDASGGEDGTENGKDAESEFVSPEPAGGTDIFHEGRGENKNFVVVIDAGHQDHAMNGTEPNGPGSDDMKMQLTSGTQGVYTNIPEYELTLDVSLKLRDELLKEGYTVVMVRETNDVEVSNVERALIANKYKPSGDNDYICSVNIRVHANGFDSPDMRGALMYCSTASNPYAIGELFEECYDLSMSILEPYCELTGMPQYKSPVMYGDDMTGTNWCEIPTTIIELGFMSNKEDDILMATDEFRLNAAVGIKQGIENFFSQYR